MPGVVPPDADGHVAAGQQAGEPLAAAARPAPAPPPRSAGAARQGHGQPVLPLAEQGARRQPEHLRPDEVGRLEPLRARRTVGQLLQADRQQHVRPAEVVAHPAGPGQHRLLARVAAGEQVVQEVALQAKLRLGHGALLRQLDPEHRGRPLGHLPIEVGDVAAAAQHQVAGRRAAQAQRHDQRLGRVVLRGQPERRGGPGPERRGSPAASVAPTSWPICWVASSSGTVTWTRKYSSSTIVGRRATSATSAASASMPGVVDQRRQQPLVDLLDPPADLGLLVDDQADDRPLDLDQRRLRPDPQDRHAELVGRFDGVGGGIVVTSTASTPAIAEVADHPAEPAPTAEAGSSTISPASLPLSSPWRAPSSRAQKIPRPMPLRPATTSDPTAVPVGAPRTR